MVPGSRIRAPLAFAAAIVLSIMGRTNLDQFRYPGGLTACKIPCTSVEAASTEARSSASPFTHSHPVEPDEGFPVLEKARIFHPCRDKARAVSPPIPPVAPRTRAVRDAADISFSLLNLSWVESDIYR